MQHALEYTFFKKLLNEKSRFAFAWDEIVCTVHEQHPEIIGQYIMSYRGIYLYVLQLKHMTLDTIDRREFVRQSFLSALAVSIGSEFKADLYHLAILVTAPDVAIPKGKKLPFGWAGFAVGKADTDPDVVFRFPNSTPTGPLRLRFTVGIDVREEKQIQVLSAQTNQLLGTIDARFAYATELYELLLTEDKAHLLKKEGIRLQLIQGSSPIWFIAPSKNMAFTGLQPHVIADRPAKDLEKTFYNNLGSLHSIQQFSWMEGCVTDGLLDWWKLTKAPRAKQALDAHYALFFDKDKRLVYQNARSEPADGTIYGIECPLPLAALAELDPSHPALDLLIQFVQKRTLPNGAIQESGLTTEGCYTLAYPMAVLAKQRKDVSLARLAFGELKVRYGALVTSEIVYQRQKLNGNAGLANWGRGITWYLLGTVRTLTALQPFSDQLDQTDFQDMQNLFRKTVERILKARDAQGCWHAFVGEPETGVDMSGTAGIAAAIALATKAGWLPQETLSQLVTTRESLFRYLTPDGFLTGICQSNRGGEALQRNGYRVISQYAMGLMAQFLIATKS